jgi:hypothetical protein
MSFGRSSGIITVSPATSYYFEDRCSLDSLRDINWLAVEARRWSGNGVPSSVKEGKQAEFLIEQSFPWNLVERVGVLRQSVADKVYRSMSAGEHRPRIELKPDWYY